MILLNRTWLRTAFSSLLPIIILLLITLISLHIWISNSFRWDENVSIPDHYIRSYLLNNAIRAGNYYPQWFSSLFYGYGYPLLLFTPPLPVYLISFFSFLNDDLLIYSIKLTGILAGFVGSTGVYYFVSHYNNKPASVIAGALYVLSPYAFVANLQVRGAIAEALALALIPWALFNIVQIFDHRFLDLRNLLLLSIFSSLILSTHNISFMIYSGIFGFVMISGVLASRANSIACILIQVFILVIIPTFLVGFSYLLNIYIYLPQVQSELASTLFNENFFWRLLSPEGELNIVDLFSFNYQNLLQVIDNFSSPLGFYGPLFISLILVFIYSQFYSSMQNHYRYRFLNISFVLLLALLIWLSTSSSLWVYRLFHFLQFVQFPWRYHGVIYLLICLLIGINLPNYPQNQLLNILNIRHFPNIIWCIIICTFGLLLYQNTILQSRFQSLTGRIPTWSGRDLLSSSEANRYGAGTTGGGEFLPKTAAWDTQTTPSLRRGIRVLDEEFPQAGWTAGILRVLSGNALFSSVSASDGHIAFQADCSEESEIAIHQMYFPLWSATNNRTQTLISIIGIQEERNLNFGIMKIRCHIGTNNIDVHFNSGPSNYISVTSFIFLLILAFSTSRTTTCRILFTILILSCLILIFILLALKYTKSSFSRIRYDLYDAIDTNHVTITTPKGVSSRFQPPFVEPRMLALPYGSANRQDRRRWIYAHPHSEISFTHNVSRYDFLHGACATDPELANQPFGDGVEFQVWISSDGTPDTMVYSRVVNPRSNTDDFHWHDFWIDLGNYAGQNVTVRLITDYNGDPRNDWGGWGAPEIVAWPDPRENPGAIHPWYAPTTIGIAAPPDTWKND